MALSNYVVVQYCYQFLIEQISMGLLIYSHLPVALTALLFSLFVLIKARTLPALLLFNTCLVFTLWCVFDLGAWFAFLGSYSSMFTWSLLDFLAVLMFFFGYYFLYTFSTGKDLPLWQKISGLALILPVAYISISSLNIPVYDLNSCAAVEDGSYTIYTYYVEAIFILAAFIFTIFQYRRKKDTTERLRTLLASIGVLIFFLFFFSASFLVSMLAASDVSTYVYNYLIYGLFGMPIFLVFLGYVVVRYQAFNLRMFGAQALVIGLIALIGAQFFFTASLPVVTLIAVTLFLACIGGYFLVKSVKKEVKQRLQIEELAATLDAANEKLKILDKMKSEFVSIASHQLRSPLTSIRGYASMLAEGSYGKLPLKVQEVAERIADSAKYMALSVEDYLNVSRIEAGNMKYEYSDFSLKEITEKVVDELRSVAMKKGLVMVFRSDCDAGCLVHADIGKTRQVLMNLIDNSMKYTPRGTITVVAHDDVKKKKMYVTIQDTGVGMSKETQSEVFEKFVRAKNANNVNVTGTGLGLFVAKKMVEDMKGKVTAESEGEGKGSTFTIEFPLITT